MNKVVNINLNGFIFSIDENAYEKLKAYVDGLRKHFAGTSGAAEIISDIETRIAELLQMKITDRYSVVQMSDVEEVIALMGDPREIDGDEKEQPAATEEPASSARNQSRKLRRDPRNKVISGVCAGVANYFEIDPIIPRALFLISFFVFGTGILVYVLLWIATPEATPAELPDLNKSGTKRLFRDPDSKMLGGVCSGLGSYLGIDSVWIRVGFLVSFFVFGSGLLLYFILWLAIPKANTAAEKLQMKGEPVDVNNIERKVREAFEGSNEHIKAGATAAAKGMASGVGAAGEVLGSLIRIFGRLVGFVLTSVGVGLGALIIVIIAGAGDMEELSEFVKVFTGDTVVYSALIWGLGLFILSFAVAAITAGIRLLFNLKYKIKVLSLLFGAINITGIFLMVYAGIKYITTIDEEETITEQVIKSTCPDTLYLMSNNRNDTTSEHVIRISDDDGDEIIHFNKVDDGIWLGANSLTMKAAKDDSLTVQMVRSSHGATDTEAKELASAIDYKIEMKDSLILLDPQLLVTNQVYKYQHVSLRLKVPVGTVIKVDPKILAMINRSDFHDDEFDLGETLVMTKNGLKCLDCEDNWDEDEDDKEESININIGKDAEETKDEEENSVHIQIGGKDDKEEVVEVKKNSDGTITETKVKVVGPVTITKKETKKKK